MPIGIFYVALDHLPKSQEEKDFEQEERDHFFFYWHGGFDRYWKARLIAFASWVAVMILFYTPMLMWKSAVSTGVSYPKTRSLTLVICCDL